MVFVATKNTPARLDELRGKRRALLAVTDWAIGGDSPFDDAQRERVKAYREALRNCTKPPAGQAAALPIAENYDLPAAVLRDIAECTSTFG